MRGQQLIDNINKGMDAYHDDVEAMSDKDLWDHCFADGDIKEDDFCVQELKKRFLYGNFTETEKANQYLIDEAGYTQQEIDDMGARIAANVKAAITELSSNAPTGDKSDEG